MAALALTAILLSGALTIRAFAVESIPQGGEAAIEISAMEEDPTGETPPEADPEDSARGDLFETESRGPMEESPEVDSEAPTEENPLEADSAAPAEEEPPEAGLKDLEEIVASIFPELQADIFAIRQCLELLVYFIFPFSCAFFLVWKFCVWFYSTFVEQVL